MTRLISSNYVHLCTIKPLAACKLLTNKIQKTAERLHCCRNQF